MEKESTSAGAEAWTMSGGAERLYFELMYCRGDAHALALPEVEQLLDLACEAMRKLASGDPRYARSAPEWTALEVYPAMK
jgi:hypothetical protein